MADVRVINWQAFTAIASVTVVLFGGQWALIQTQLSSVAKEIETSRKIAEDRALILSHEQERREVEIKATVKGIQEELDRRRDEFVQQREFRQFGLRLEDVKTGSERRDGILERRLDVLEQTRPTTGVLESVTKAIEAQATRHEERIRVLEQRK